MRLTTGLARFVVLVGVFFFQITSQAANLIENGGFEGGYFPWEPPGWWAGGNGSYGVDGQGRFCTTITAVGSANWGAQLRQQGISFAEGETYDVSLKAWSSVPVNIEMSATDESSGFVWIFGTRLDINAPLSGSPQEINLSFTAGANTEVGIFRFLLGGGDVPLNETVCFDDIAVEAPAVNLLTNSTFDEGVLLPPGEIGFYEGSAGSAGVDAEGRYCIIADDPGPNPWSLQYRENDITYINGRTYEFSADVWSSTPVSMEISGVDENGGFTWIFGSNFNVDAPLGGPPQRLSAFFTAAADTETGKFRFLMGNGHVPAGTTVCLDNLALLDPQGSEEPELPPPPPVHVNQLGYLPFASKRATYALPEGVPDADLPRSWILMLGDAVITSGTTLPHGTDIDSASGDRVHIVDFSSVTTEGDGYTLVVNEAEQSFTSEPFAIGADIYSQLKYDALAYFYHNRSGTPILAEVVGETWARPAGHLSDSAVETLACLDGTEGCVTLDAGGGWYDAGDHGKYVVNGG
ncbi:MAG TPA: carbohydrate binding domain-containing protein, partial [Gammaproteobacteria bacterium]